MYKNIIYLILVIVFGSCQINNSQAKTPKPQKVYRITQEFESNKWYKKQSELWKKEIDKNPANEQAWYNYYNANRYARFENISTPERIAKLAKIIEDMGKAIPGTYTYHLLKYWNTYNCQDMTDAEKALAINPDRPDIYYAFLAKAMIAGDEKLLKETCIKLYQSRDTAPWLLNYNYNMLMSVEKNGILFTNGDNDTYPGLLVQQVKGIRTDVQIINTSMILDKEYFKNNLVNKGFKLDYSEIIKGLNKSNLRVDFVHKFIHLMLEKYPKTPLYFAVTIYGGQTKPFKSDLYLTGLAFRHSFERIDNIALVKKNLEKEFHLDYLEMEVYNDLFPGKNLQAYTNLNYISPMLVLGEHYKAGGEKEKAEYWKNLALKLAERAGKDDMVQEIKNKLE